MFGYATDETPELMPLTHVLATQLGYKLTEVRKNGVCPWLRPDGKTQVTVEYKKDGGAVVPLRVHTILISTQHSPDVSNDKIKEDLMEHVIKPVVRGQAALPLGCFFYTFCVRCSAVCGHDGARCLAFPLAPTRAHPPLPLVPCQVPAKYLDDKTIFHLNPSGRFVIGGPHGDAGLTGRKIIIDTYGGWGAHGGGAFSGKVLGVLPGLLDC